MMGLCRAIQISSVIAACSLAGGVVTSAYAEDKAADEGKGGDDKAAAKPSVDPKRIYVGLVAHYGAFWMPDGTGAEVSEATSIQAFGVRVLKGLIKEIALEAEVIGANTGIANFSDFAVGGAVGQYDRWASLGMFKLGFMLRSNRGSYDIYGRVGVGLQAAVFQSQFVVNGSLRERPDDSFDIDGFYRVGAGADLKMGSSAVLGAAASYTQGQTQQTFMLGLHLSYGL